jgi:outer membrane immunogenic protein
LEKHDMRKFAALVAAAGLWAGATPASAGAIEAIVTEPPPAVVGPYWTGFYVGAYGGGGWQDSASFTDLNEIPHQRWTVSGGGSFIGGATLGFNWQLDALVLGVEAEVGYFAYENRSVDPFNPTLVGYATTNDWQEFIGGRIGWAWDNLLVYGKAGVVFSQFQSRIYAAGAENYPLATAENGDSAWAVGGGLEYALTRSWSAKIEYLHVDFDSTAPARHFEAFNGPSFFWTTEPGAAQMVKFGVNYKFVGWNDEPPLK